jgi:hypothetical protein
MKKILRFLSNNYLLVLCILLFPVMSNRSTRIDPRSVIWSDGEGYYKYLPGLFIIGDMHKIPEGSVKPQRNEQGEILMKYTCGVALFEAPFFLVARAYTKWKGQDWQDIFHPNYARSVAISGFLIGFLGLGLLKSALLRYFSSGVTFWTVMAVFGGTNLFHYTTREMGMSHVYSFFLLVALVWHIPRWYERPNWQRAALLGGILGWAILIRPTNIVVALLVLGWEVYNFSAIQQRWQFYVKHWQLLPVAAFSALLFFIPQMLYWKEMTGNWILYSYADEGFPNWNAPKIAEVLFDVQNGLFIYSPMALLMVIGALRGVWLRSYSGPIVSLIFALSTYIFASWWAWWFGGAFGHRCYVELYAIMAIPLAGLFAWAARSHSWVKWSMVVLTIFLIYYSVKLSYLYNELPGPWDGKDWWWNWDKLWWIYEHLF